MLSEHQKKALEDYYDLMERYPDLFTGRNRRPIVSDKKILEAYASQKKIVLGVVAATKDLYFLVDLVESRPEKGKPFHHPYSRIVYRNQLDNSINVVVLATIEDVSLGQLGDVVLLAQERHSLGSVGIELPRGFGQPGLSGEENAIRELQEETGFIGKEAIYLGSTFTDSGIMDGRVSFYHIPVIERKLPSAEPEEAIVKVCFASRESIWEEIRKGKIRDGFTVQALALYESRLD
jgi:ADP-ribose pyrophosphatase